jgi:hypothetical protein
MDKKFARLSTPKRAFVFIITNMGGRVNQEKSSNLVVKFPDICEENPYKKDESSHRASFFKGFLGLMLPAF